MGAEGRANFAGDFSVWFSGVQQTDPIRLVGGEFQITAAHGLIKGGGLFFHAVVIPDRTEE